MDYPLWDVPLRRLNSVTFRILSGDEIKAISVKEINNPKTFDALLHAQNGGLHDLALGAFERNEVCSTCGQIGVYCPGHMGHIQLPLPVFSPGIFLPLFTLLRGSCFNCHRLLISGFEKSFYKSKIALLDHGLLLSIKSLEDKAALILLAADNKARNISNMDCESLEAFAEDCIKTEKTEWVALRNIESIRNAVINQLTKKMISPVKKCLHCCSSLGRIKQVKQCKVFMVNRTENSMHKCRRDSGKGSIEEICEESDSGEDDPESLKGDKVYITPIDARNHLREVWKHEGPLLKCLYGSLSNNLQHPTDIFFMDIIPVAPSRFRPFAVIRDTKLEHSQTSNLAALLRESESIRTILNDIATEKEPLAETTSADKVSLPLGIVSDNSTTKLVEERLLAAWTNAQIYTNCIMDKNLHISPNNFVGVKQLLEKKDGLFRKHMMGKRVNFAARSVITPDPCISTFEVGIPEVFAKNLTYPQTVTPWNVQKLRQLVINGPLVYPGAESVINERGFKMRLPTNKTSREVIAKQLLTPSTQTDLSESKKVCRHLLSGDFLLLNRQPTLHKPSMQCHKARVLANTKTFRLHYANCKAYNADFDGDEMNAHFPQNEMARAEASVISSTEFQYLVPKDGTPLAGLIQDHVVAGVMLTIRGQFFNRVDYNHLVYSALVDKNESIELLPPAVLKPYQLWSGKQVVSTILLNLIPKGKKPLTLNGTSKISEKCWAQATMSKAMYSFPHLFNMDESRVIFRDGHLLCGVMDKGHYGATSYGLIHCCYELYGGQVAGKMLTSLGKLFTGFLQLFGFTLGVEDILVTSKANEKRQKIIKKSRHIGSEVAAEVEALHLESVDSDTLTRELRKAHFSKDDKLIAELDNAVKKKTSEIQNSIMNACMPKGLLKRFPKNNLQLMVNSGAKGTSVNTMQISCLLGQIELEGKRPPLMLSGRFLPSFLPYDVSPKAGGFVTGRFLTGIKPQEYFFHCMAGREGLIDTAVKTSRSGYLQRCLVKHLEGVIVNYDLTVRDSDGSVIQFYYGEDSLDVMKIGFLGKNQFPFLVQNREVYPMQKYTSVRATATSSAKRLQREIQKWKATHSPNTKIQSSSFLDFCDQMDRELVTKRHYRYSGKLGRTKATQILLKAWWKLSKDEKSGFRKIASCPDPVMSRFLPYAHNSVVTELLLETVNTYCKKSLPHIFCSNESDETKEKITRDNFKKLINFKFHDSIVDPGESVGLLCAQSVGEPSTQMTLNTFHFAGCGEMNVTLGIPRLREILMVASRQVKTPTMDVPVIDTSYAQEQAKLLQKKLNKVTLSQVLQDVQVWETLATRTKGKHHRLYRVRFQFLPASVYGDYSCLTPWQVLHFVETTYLKQLWQVMNKRMSELSAANMVTSVKNTAEPGEKEESVDDVNEDAEEEEGAVEPPMNDPNQEEELMISDTDLKDDDAAAVKWRLRQMDDQDYDGEEEEIEEIIVEQQDSGVECEQDQENKPVVAQSVSSKTEADSMSGKQEDKRILGVVHQIPAIVEYQYDEEEHLWCEVTYKFNLENSKVDLMSLLKAHAQKTVVHQVAGITRSFLTEVRKNDKRTELHMQTEGINITEMSYYDNILDVNSLYCNDINAIANKYGIEAAGKAIIKEVQAVFAVYGIKVDYRHLSLLADFMTFEGIFQPFDRKRMNSCPSPIQKMTFESAMQFLIKASMHSSKDTLSSPSARLVTGRVLSCGTGNFDIVVPLIR